MRMRTKVSFVTVVGAGALLLCALAVIFTLRAQTAYASIRPPHGEDHPRVEVSLLDTTVAPGEYLQFGVLFHDIPCVQGTDPGNDENVCNYEDKFPMTSVTSTNCSKVPTSRSHSSATRW